MQHRRRDALAQLLDEGIEGGAHLLGLEPEAAAGGDEAAEEAAEVGAAMPGLEDLPERLAQAARRERSAEELGAAALRCDGDEEGWSVVLQGGLRCGIPSWRP
ncbi:hypothetical protein Rmf_35760 [Roseomonas fluvialis]|uniref:Uncharacterized protein n=1 Tax=Roseomonas fluvialis TaxID=1750527 RepID=A0ABM7Y6R3_9PROT|nr:hypothetical protein Rmf_35760 [Roseomonas fluvialis]